MRNTIVNVIHSVQVQDTFPKFQKKARIKAIYFFIYSDFSIIDMIF